MATLVSASPVGASPSASTPKDIGAPSLTTANVLQLYYYYHYHYHFVIISTIIISGISSIVIQKCTSKGMQQQGILVAKHRNSLST